MSEIRVKTFTLEPPLDESDVTQLQIGDMVQLTGTLYTGRDTAHQRLIEMIERGESLPFDTEGQVLYYVGPSPAPPGLPIGAAGPTTSYRMDKFTPPLLARGIRATIGKGPRSNRVLEAMQEHNAVYFAALGGGGALLSSCIEAAEVVAFKDLGTEAIHRLSVVDFPVVVINDTRGNDLYDVGMQRWRQAAVSAMLGIPEEDQ